MPKRDESRFKHMLRHAEEAVQFAADRARSDLDTDRQLNLSLVRLLEIVGEAAARVTPGTQQQHATIPWSQIIGLRNRLIHGYDAVDFDILWDIIQIDLPPLIAQLSCIVGDGLAQGMTESLIRVHPHPSSPACVYSWEYFLEYDAEGLAGLPVGLQRLVAIQDLDGGVQGEGFCGHLGNRTHDETDEVEDSIPSSIDALRALGATEAVEIATAALREWSQRLPEWRTTMQQGKTPDIGSFDAIADPLDHRWYEQTQQMYRTIDAYMKAHPDEFVHP